MSAESAYTSRNQVPALMKMELLKGVNLDYGGGKYDKATEYLATQGVNNFVIDPFNRSKEHNDWAFDQTILGKRLDSITCLNVLNVIPDANERESVVRHISIIASQHYLLRHRYPTIYFQVYNGKCKKVNEDVQVRKPMSFYEPMLKMCFPSEHWQAYNKGNCMWFKRIY